MSARHFEIIKRPELIVPEAALRRRSICYSGSRPPLLIYRGNNQVVDSSGSHTHSGLAFGPASSDRAIIVINTTNADTNNSCTIAGGAATLCIRAINVSGFRTEIWIKAVPTGTSGTVVLSGPTSALWTTSVAVYSVNGLKSLTPTDTDWGDDWNGSSFDATVNTTVNVQGGGFVISSAFDTGGSASSATWTGVTQDFFASTGSSGRHSGASVASNVSKSITTTTKFGSEVGKVAATASFR